MCLCRSCNCILLKLNIMYMYSSRYLEEIKMIYMQSYGKL